MSLFTSAMLAASLLLVFVGPAAACSGDVAVVLFESDSGQGDSITLCGSNSELNNVVHAQAGDCARISFDPEGNDWNNCANSIKLWVPDYACFRTYNAGSYSMIIATYSGPRFAALIDVSNDIISGVRFYPKSENGCL